MDTLNLVLLALGTTKITSIITLEKIFDGFRDRLFHVFPPEDNDQRGFFYQQLVKATPEQYQKQKHWSVPEYKKKWVAVTDGRKPSFIGNLFSCHKCLCVWVAFANVIAYNISADITIAVNTVFALAQVSSMLIDKYYRS